MTIAELDRLAKDTGCEFHNDCLTCPFDKCIFESYRGSQRLRQGEKQARIRRMLEHMCKKEVATQLGVSLRTVQRAVKEHNAIQES